MDENQSWKMKTFIIGAIIGTLTGLGAAYMIIQRAKADNTRPKVTAGEGVKIGLGVLGLLRLVSDIGSEK
jgi:glucokinase